MHHVVSTHTSVKHALQSYFNTRPKIVRDERLIISLLSLTQSSAAVLVRPHPLQLLYQRGLWLHNYAEFKAQRRCVLPW
jgi:hypothetical protein